MQTPRRVRRHKSHFAFRPVTALSDCTRPSVRLSVRRNNTARPSPNGRKARPPVCLRHTSAAPDQTAIPSLPPSLPAVHVSCNLPTTHTPRKRPKKTHRFHHIGQNPFRGHDVEKHGDLTAGRPRYLQPLQPPVPEVVLIPRGWGTVWTSLGLSFGWGFCLGGGNVG